MENKCFFSPPRFREIFLSYYNTFDIIFGKYLKTENKSYLYQVWSHHGYY